jgi:hypothetical protein
MSFMNAVDTSTLDKTIANLTTALDLLAQAHTPQQEWMARNSAVLEFTLCWARVRPSLERALINLDALDHDIVKTMSLAQLVRAANERGYTSVEWELWDQFRRARNSAAHEYREELANEIVGEAKRFLPAISEIAAKIKEKSR